MRFILPFILILIVFDRAHAQQLDIQYASYFGGSEEDYPIQSIFDAENNAYVVGYTESADFPTTDGSYQETFGGGNSDGFIMKFNPDHTLAWSTYFGGENVDVINDVIIQNNIIYLIGFTQSSTNISNGNLSATTLNGICDGLFIAMHTSGEIISSGYIGGNDYDLLHGISSDENGNIYVSGKTQSNAGIATINSFQSTLLGTTDGWLAKMNIEGEIIWSTYYGGMGIDEFNDICITPAGNIGCAGKTNSNDIIITEDGYQTNIGGSTDGLICIFNSSGLLVYSTYIGGPSPDELRRLTSFSGMIAAVGIAKSESGISTGDDVFQAEFGGASQDGVFVTINEFTSDVYISYIGGDGFDECFGIHENQDQLWIAMSSSSTDLPYDDLFENESWGMSDAYFISFDTNLQRTFSAYIRGILPDNIKTILGSDQIILFGQNYALENYTTEDAFSSAPSGLGDVLMTVISNPLKIQNIEPCAQIHLYPNPCRNVAYLDLPLNDWRIQVIDIKGNLIHEEMHAHTPREVINFSQLSSGLYFVRCISEKSIHSGTLVRE